MEFSDLPPEIIIHIFSFLDASFVRAVLSRVDRRLARLVADPVVWRLRISRRWPEKYPPVEPSDPGWDWGRACAEREKFASKWADFKARKTNAKVKGHYSSVDACLLMQNGLLVTGSRDRSIALWNTRLMGTDDDNNNTSLIQKWADVHKGWVWSLSKSGHDSLLSCGWDNKANLWHLTSSEMVLVTSVNCSTALLCSDINQGSNLVAVGTFDKKVKMFDLRSPKPTVASVKHHKMPVLAVKWTSEHNFVSASEDGTLALLDCRTRKVLSRLFFKDCGFPMCMDLMEGCPCIVVGDKTGGIHLINASTMEQVKAVTGLHAGKITGVSLHMGGIVTGSTDKTVKILHPDMGLRQVATLSSEKDFGDVTAISVLDDSIAIGHSMEVIQVWKDKDIVECDS